MRGTLGGRTNVSRTAAPIAALPKIGVAEVGTPYLDFGQVAQYKADRATSVHDTAGTLTQWDDLSPNANHLTTSGTGFGTGAHTLNGKNVLDGATGRIMGSSVTYPASGLSIVDTTGACIYMVVSLQDTGNPQHIVGLGTTFGCSPGLRYDDATENSPNPATFLAIGGCGSSTPSDGPDTPAGGYLIRWTLTGGNATAIYVGGVSSSTGLGRGLGNTGAAVNAFTLGGSQLTSRIAEVLVFNTPTPALDSDVRAYLASEWAVSA